VIGVHPKCVSQCHTIIIISNPASTSTLERLKVANRSDVGISKLPIRPKRTWVVKYISFHSDENLNKRNPHWYRHRQVRRADIKNPKKADRQIFECAFQLSWWENVERTFYSTWTHRILEKSSPKKRLSEQLCTWRYLSPSCDTKEVRIQSHTAAPTLTRVRQLWRFVNVQIVRCFATFQSL